MQARRSLDQRLSSQRALLGLLQSYPHPVLPELAALCGYDFVFLDGEHGVFTDMDYLQAMRAIGAADALAIVRLGDHDVQAVGRAMDLGADALVVPNVST